MQGTYFEDTLQLGDMAGRNPPVRGPLGCHDNEDHLFYTQKPNGIMGLASDGKGASLWQRLLADNPHVDTRVFSICLADRGGELSVGGYRGQRHKGAVSWARMMVHTNRYVVFPTSMALEQVPSEVLATTFGGTFVDSGTTFTFMASDMYKALTGALMRYCAAHDHGCGAVRHGACVTVEGGDLSKFPTIALQFEGATGPVRWRPDSYLYPTGHGVYCLAFQNDGPGADLTLGTSWMLHKEVIFDVAKQRLGMAEAHCPENVPPASPKALAAAQRPGAEGAPRFGSLLLPAAVLAGGVAGRLLFVAWRWAPCSPWRGAGRAELLE